MKDMIWDKIILKRSNVKFTGLRSREGKVGWAILWLLGIPLPVLLIIFILRGCQ